MWRYGFPIFVTGPGIQRLLGSRTTVNPCHIGKKMLFTHYAHFPALPSGYMSRDLLLVIIFLFLKSKNKRVGKKAVFLPEVTLNFLEDVNFRSRSVIPILWAQVWLVRCHFERLSEMAKIVSGSAWFPRGGSRTADCSSCTSNSATKFPGIPAAFMSAGRVSGILGELCRTLQAGIIFMMHTFFVACQKCYKYLEYNFTFK